jgi:internalin A
MNREEQQAYDEALKEIEKCRKKGGRFLNLGGMGLSQLPPEIGQLTKLTELYLHDNQLSTLPPEIGQLSQLTQLHLWKNQLSALPPELGQLSQLTKLHLYGNQLSTLPPEIGQLSNLNILSIGQNPLRGLPESIQFCHSLEKLDLSKTQLKLLPDGLRKLPKLTHLNVAECKGLGLPTEITGRVQRWEEPNAQQVLDYYFSREEQGERPLNEVKLLLVGRGEAGKTCVSRALRGEDFDKNQKETPGIEIEPWILKYPDGDPIKVHLWDFAGQEITHETHRFFLTERSLYLVVLDGRTDQQMEEAEYWLNHVERYGTRRDGDTIERSPAIVVLNKWESPGPYDAERRRLQREFPNIKAFVETDCKSGLGIKKLEETIRSALDNMPDVRETWPTSYFKVRQLLDKRIDHGDHFMTWGDFTKVCQKAGEKDKGRQKSMAANLNALGVALYYGNDDRLRDTRVLNPNWAANGLYGLIRGVNKKPHQGDKGYLWAGDIAQVLTEGMKGMDSARGASIKDYPEKRHGVKVHEFLLDLMVERELGFQSGEYKKKTVYLLPGLLEQDEPDPKMFDIDKHTKESEVRFRYVYEIFPAGVMSRFIVRTHPLSEKQDRWKSGVVLEWGKAKALVLCERRRNPKIDIYIHGGTNEEHQALAGIVRVNLEAIHSGLPEGLKGVEELDLSPSGEQYEMLTKLITLEKANKPVQVIINNEPNELPVKPELERVQPKEARQPDAPKLKVFVSYAHNDYKIWDRFKAHLAVLKNSGLIQWWFDGKIRPGTDWDHTIRQELKEADIIILMISTEFFASSYINGVEIKKALEQHHTGQSKVLPVMWENCPSFFSHPELGKLQAIPSVKGKLKPIRSFNPQRNGWVEVELELREMIAEIVKQRRM